MLLSIQIHFCEELSIEIRSYLAQSSDFENLAEYPSIPAETGVVEVLWKRIRERKEEKEERLIILELCGFTVKTHQFEDFTEVIQ